MHVASQLAIPATSSFQLSTGTLCSLAATHPETLVGAGAIRCEMPPERGLAAKVSADPAATLPNPGITAGTSLGVSFVALHVSEPIPAPFPYVT